MTNVNLAHWGHVSPAQAYIDPGSGSMFFQVLMAAIIGGLFQIRKLAEFIRSVVEKKEERHHIGEPGFIPASRTMVHIGG